MNRYVALLLGLLFCAASVSADVVDASVCDVLANPAAFDGKILRLQNATVIAGFDEFVIEGSDCSSGDAIWLSYPENAKLKAGPAALVRLQLAKNGAPSSAAPKRVAVTLQKDRVLERFDSLLATPHKSDDCLGCPRYTVSATLVGRLDGVSTAGLLRDANGKVTGLAGFGNLNLYRARLVLQSVSSIAPHEISYAASAPAVKGDLKRVGERAAVAEVQRAIAAYGAEGEDNGVLLGFGVANEIVPVEGANADRESPDGVLYAAMFDMTRIGKAMLPKAMAHVGTHIADSRARMLPRTLAEAEVRAWRTTAGEQSR